MKLNIAYLKINEKFKDAITVTIILDAKICHIENNTLDFNLLIIEKETMNIIFKKNYKIYFANPKLEFPLLLEPNKSTTYYLFFSFLYDLNNLEIIKIQILLQNDNYFELINYHQNYDDKRLLDVLKNELESNNIKFNTLEYKEKIFS